MGRKNAYQQIEPSMGEAAGGYKGTSRAGACPARAVVMEGTNMAQLTSAALPGAPPSLPLAPLSGCFAMKAPSTELTYNVLRISICELCKK